MWWSISPLFNRKFQSAQLRYAFHVSHVKGHVNHVWQGPDVIEIPRGPDGTRGVQRRRRQEVRPLQYPELPEEPTHSSGHIQWNAGKIMSCPHSLLRHDSWTCSWVVWYYDNNLLKVTGVGGINRKTADLWLYNADSLVMLTCSVGASPSASLLLPLTYNSASACVCVCVARPQVVMNNQRKIIWPGGETEKPQGFQMSTRLKVWALSKALTLCILVVPLPWIVADPASTWLNSSLSRLL